MLMDAGWAECPGRSTGRCAQSEPPKKWARTNTPGPASTAKNGRRIRRSLVEPKKDAFCVLTRTQRFLLHRMGVFARTYGKDSLATFWSCKYAPKTRVITRVITPLDVNTRKDSLDDLQNL